MESLPSTKQQGHDQTAWNITAAVLPAKSLETDSKTLKRSALSGFNAPALPEQGYQNLERCVEIRPSALLAGCSREDGINMNASCVKQWHRRFDISEEEREFGSSEDDAVDATLISEAF